jgi:hypothetical protein
MASPLFLANLFLVYNIIIVTVRLRKPPLVAVSSAACGAAGACQVVGCKPALLLLLVWLLLRLLLLLVGIIMAGLWAFSTQ